MKNKNIYKLSSFLILSSFSLLSLGCNNIDSLFFTVNGKDIEVTFCDKGASIYSLKYKDTFLTYHPKDKNTFIKDDYYYGKALGRVAGRIPDGKISVEGKNYSLEVNETSGNKHNTLHGGKNSFSAAKFNHIITETNDYIYVCFNYVSPSLEAGFPYEVDSWFNYRVHKNESVIDINIKATTTGTTPLNLSNHPLFRLSNSGDVRNHLLTIPSSKIAKYDDYGGQTVIGTETIDSSSPYYFKDGKSIGNDIEEAKAKDPVSGGYDNIWVFDDTNSSITLKNPDNNISLNVSSDADAVICYSNCYPHDGMEINPSGTDSLYSGISIEPIKFFTRNNVSSLNVSPDTSFTRNITYTITQN